MSQKEYPGTSGSQNQKNETRSSKTNSFRDALDDFRRKLAENKEEMQARWEERQRYLRKSNETMIKRFLERNIGVKYVQEFRENKVAKKKYVDAVIRNLLTERKGAIITGDVGVGKTMILLYIAKKISEAEAEKRLIEHGTDLYRVPVSYFYMPELFTRLHKGEMPRLFPYILLDDWGREYAEPFAFSQFETMVEKMYANGVGLVITTNLTKDEFLSRPGWERINDRVRKMCGLLSIAGSSRRQGIK